jgi:hypothetical protein
MKNSEQNDLRAKLAAWKVAPQMPGSFQREVWRCIAARQAERESAFWPRISDWFFTRLVRPQYAAVLVMLSLAGSLGVAHMQAQDAMARHWKALEARYAASVDPLIMVRPGQ